MRIQYSDAIYHVMARGNGRQDIVQDDADRKGLSRSDLVISYYGGRVDVEAS